MKSMKMNGWSERLFERKRGLYTQETEECVKEESGDVFKGASCMK